MSVSDQTLNKQVRYSEILFKNIDLLKLNSITIFDFNGRGITFSNTIEKHNSITISRSLKKGIYDYSIEYSNRKIPTGKFLEF